MNSSESANDPLLRRVFDGHLQELQARTDNFFGWLLIAQWLFGIICAALIAPYAWPGTQRNPQSDLWIATLLGGALISLPLALISLRPGGSLTRQVVAIVQVVYSLLLIRFMGVQFDAHFYVFGSFALLAFYRDAKVFLPAIILVVADYLTRGVLWPASVFGMTGAAPWPAVEHAGWLALETSFLVWGVARSRSDLLALSKRQVSLTVERDLLEHNVENRVTELQQQRLLLQEVIDNIPGAVFWKDANLRYLGCNHTFAGTAGATSPTAIVGKLDQDLPWTPDQKALRRDSDLQVIESLQPKLNVEEFVRTASGERKTLLTSKVPLLNPSGQAVGVIGIYHDVSDRKLLEAQLSQAQKLESIGQLAAGIAHEINTPMQCVGGNVEFLKNCYQRLFKVVDTYREYLDGPSKDWRQRKVEMERLIAESHYDHLRDEAPAAIEEASDAVHRVIEIVSAMKAMSHPGTKEKVSTNINELIRNAAAISKNRWKYVAEMRFALEEPLPDVKALPAELSQVFLNLIVNAADAIAENRGDGVGELGRITIRTVTEAAGVRIDVEDTGGGVPDSVRERIFDPFFTTKDVGKGTGQGLAIAYDLVVNKHQGRITLDPAPGKGAKFSVWLPCRGVDGADDEAAAESCRPASTRVAAGALIAI